jgi:hypothetical protein
MLARLSRKGPWISLVGVVSLLSGLGWDAVLHRLDPALAEREGIFTLSNPGHALFALGIGLCTAGCALFLLGRTTQPGGVSAAHRAAWLGSAAALAALSAVSLALATSGPGGLAGHSHGDTSTAGVTTVHSHEPLGALTVDPLGGQASPDAAAGHDHGVAATSSDAATVRSASGVVHAHGVETPITAEQLAAATKLWQDTKDGTAQYAALSVAQAAGYYQITPWVGSIAHFHNPSFAASDRQLDPTRPDELIYVRLPDKSTRLVGAMFLAKPGQAGPKIGGPLTVWHAHDNLCFSLRTSMVAALADANGSCPTGTLLHPTPEMLHVWLVDNPAGIFSEDMAPSTLVALLTGQSH